jgi:glycosyltransferase involved in cell wall biosynthesis
VTEIAIQSALRPYTSPEAFSRSGQGRNWQEIQAIQDVEGKLASLSGGYGQNLFHEVARYAEVAAQIATEQQFDVVHAHDWLTFPAGVAASRISGKPLVLHVHATEFDRSGENINRAVYEMERQGLQSADTIVAVSALTRDILVARYGANPNKIKVVHNGVLPMPAHQHRERPQRKMQVVTFLGRVTFQKGPDYFIEAAARVLGDLPSVRFVMAGTGDMLLPMIRKAARMKLGSRIHFTGFLGGADPYKLYGLSDVYVMPSVSEPFGISALEALQSGVPVIVSKQSGAAEILRHAIKVDFWDVDRLASSIVGVLNNRSLAALLSNGGMKEADRMGWDGPAARVNEVYNQII